jgi:uncharacterized damage-inducible protein DinB
MTTMANRYRRWFAYEKDAHEKTLQSLNGVPEGRRSDARFQKAVSLLGHLVAARQLWLHRLGIRPAGPRTLEEFFPKDLGLDELATRLRDMHQEWSDYLSGVDEAELSRVFEYRSLEGDRYRNRVEDILTQLFGHSWYHRGQVAALVRELGAEPAATDYVFWVREPVEEEARP